MLCSDCSKEVKPVVAIDIDGTLADYHGHFFKFAEMYWGQDYLDRKGKLWEPYDGSVELHEYMGLPLSEYREGKLAYRQGGWKRDMPCFSGGPEIVRQIRKRAEVFITTTRPYLRLDQTDPDTREWLRRNGIEYDGLLYHEDKYFVLDTIVDHGRVVAIVDDLASQYDSAREIYGDRVPILRVNEYNSALKRPNMTNLLGIWDEVEKRIDEWERNNG